MRWCFSAIIASTLVGFAGTARAQDASEIAFAAGQFVGTASFCGVPRDEVLPIAAAMLKLAGVDPDGPSPGMTRFKEGVTAGTKEMNEKPPVTCNEVKEGVSQMKTQLNLQ
jgi:hypothetical protein